MGTDDSWTCSIENLQYWNSIHFRERTYSPAVLVDSPYNPSYPNGIAIRAELGNDSNRMYCRKQFGGTQRIHNNCKQNV